MTESGTCLLIAIIFLVVSISIIVIGIKLDTKWSWSLVLIVGILGFVGFLIMGVCSIGCYEKERWNRALEEDYTFYYDGEVIEHPENYNYRSFKIDYDDENKKVLMGRDQDDDGGVIIMPAVTP